MLTEIPQLPPMLPIAEETRPYTGEDYPEYLRSSVFFLENNGFLRASGHPFITNSVGNAVFLNFSADSFLDIEEVSHVTHANIRSDIDRICFDLRLSKSALSEILNVSRQTIYDWISGKNENFKTENVSKVEWLSELSQYLDSDIKASLWLRRDKKLSNGLTIKNVLGDGQLSPQDLATEINTVLGMGKDAPRFVSKSQNAIGKELSDKSIPYANND